MVCLESVSYPPPTGGFRSVCSLLLFIMSTHNLDELLTRYSDSLPVWMPTPSRTDMYDAVCSNIRSMWEDEESPDDYSSDERHICCVFTSDEAQFILDSGAS